MLRYMVVACLGLASVLMSCTEQQLTKERVIEALDSTEHKLEWLEYRLAEEQWEQFAEGSSDSLEFMQQLYDQTLGNDPSYPLLRQGKGLLSDEVDVRRAELLFARLLVSKIEMQPDVIALREPTGNRGLTPRPFDREPPFRFFVGEAAGDKRRDRSARQSDMFLMTKAAVSPQLSPQLVRLRNQLARREGYNNYFALSAASLRLDVSEHLHLMEHLEQASRDAYQTILDELSSRLDGNRPEIWDLGLLLYHDAELALERYLPHDSLVDLAHRTCDSMGVSLKQLPLYWHDEFRGHVMSPVQCLSVKPPHDVRLWGDYADGVRWSSKLMGQVGQALHVLNISQERALFVNELHPYWREGITSLFASLCSESSWLEQYAGAPPALIGQFKTSQRKADVVSLRIMLAHMKFEYEMYTNSERDLNQLYWDILEQYLLIPRYEDLVIWSHVDAFTYHPVELQAALYGDMIAAQTEAYLEKQYGGLPGNGDAYSFLVQNYMRFGSRYPWEELLERGTGERLNPEYLIDRLGL